LWPRASPAVEAQRATRKGGSKQHLPSPLGITAARAYRRSCNRPRVLL
jgi:hypothetical protein